jgi:hypothetical protein
LKEKEKKFLLFYFTFSDRQAPNYDSDCISVNANPNRDNVRGLTGEGESRYMYLPNPVQTIKSPAGVPLKVPKHEIFDGGFFASKEPIWSPDS